MKPTHRYRRIQVKNADPPVALTLKDEIRVLDGGYCSLYSVNETPGMIVKLMNLVDEQIYQKFQQEVLAWSRMREEKPLFPMKQTKEGKYDSFPNIVSVCAAFRQMMKDSEMGVLVMEYCPKGSLESICGRLPAFAFKEIQIIKVAKDLLQGLCYLHCRSSPLIHRQVTMQHLLLGEDHNYKLVNFSHVTTHRYCKIKSDELEFIATEIKKHTCQGYRAPELIDIAQGSVIDEKIDVFAGGVVLFQLSYGQPPFQGTIATLNSRVEIPDFPVYSTNLSELLKLMLTRDAKERPASTKLLEYVLKNWNEFNISDEEKSPEQQQKKKQLGGLDMEIFSQDMNKVVPMKPTMFNKFKKLVTLKLQNKRTKGWILAALEENELPPKQKYVKLLILKAWQQPNKIEKFYDYFNMYVQTNCQSTVLTLKALLLLDEYIKKGPPASVGVFKKSDGKSATALNAANQQQQQPAAPSAQSILEKVIGTWEKKDSAEGNIPSTNSNYAKDKQRSGYATQLISVLSATLMKKIELCSEYACIIEGNFSLKPFFESVEKSYSNLNSSYKPLSGKLMEDMLGYFAQLITLSHQILANNTLLNIQIALMLQLTEELYCFISTFTHLHSALIMSSNYLDSHIDKGQLKIKLDYISSQFEVNFNAARNYFNKAQTAVSHLGISKKSCFIPQIDQKIIEYIKAIPRLQDAKPNQQFYVHDYLNNNTSIYGLRLPISYGMPIGVNQSVNNNAAASGGNTSAPAPNNINNSNISINNLASLPTFSKGNSQSTYNNNDQKLDQLIEFKETLKKSRAKGSNEQRQYEPSQLQFKSEPEEEESKGNSQPGKVHLIFDPDCNDDELQPQPHHPTGSNNPNNNLSQLVDFPHSTKASVSRYPMNHQGGFHDKQVHSAERRTPQEVLHRTQNQQPPWNQHNTQGTGNSCKDHVNLNSDDDDDYGCDFSQLVNENNNNYNDILDENDELQKFPIDSEHKSMGNQGVQAKNNNTIGGNERINPAENIPKNLGKFKDLQFIDFNQNIKNSKISGQQQQLSSMSRVNNQSNNDKVGGSLVDRAEEFDVMEMDENNPTIQGAKEQGTIKRHDIGTLYQSVHNDQELPLASVTSSNYSSNSEHFIELKNFIINRVKHDPSELIIDFKSLTIGKKIGSGHSGKVFQGVWNNVEVAIKEMEVNQLNERNQKEFQREIETLVKISPQINLVSLIGVAQKKDNFYVITELCNGGSMFELLHKKQTTISLPWMHRLRMAKHIATGMIYLHSLSPPVIHRDLKSLKQNMHRRLRAIMQLIIQLKLTLFCDLISLLLDIEYREDSFDYNVKIADFGLARTESKGEMTQVLGTFHWMAPEVFQNKQYTTKADVYSYGIVLWEMINRKTPYSKLSTVEIMKCVCEGKRPETDAIPEDCPPLLVELMKDCWQQDYLLRPPFTVILQRLEAIEADLKSRMNKQVR